MNTQLLFVPDDLIIERMKKHNDSVIRPQRTEEDTVKLAFARIDSLLDEHSNIVSQLKELSTKIKS